MRVKFVIPFILVTNIAFITELFSQSPNTHTKHNLNNSLDYLCDDIPVVIDKTIELNWDKTSSSWEYLRVGEYVYNENHLLSSVLYKNSGDSNNLLRILYQYNDSSQLDLQIYQKWFESNWIDSIRYQFDYFGTNLIREVKTQYWENECNCWETTVISKRYYNQDGLPDYNILQLETENERWQDYQISYFNYTNSNLLVSLVTYRIEDQLPRRQYLYTYSDNLSLIKRLTQKWNNTEGVWYDYRMIEYNRDRNDRLSSRIDYFMSEGSWEANNKIVYFYKPQIDLSENKILICHKGKSIYISRKAALSHILHGDCLGACPSSSTSQNKNHRNFKELHPPPTIYPNPAREFLTISNHDGYNYWEICTFSGIKILSKRINSNSDIQIRIGNIPNGIYFIKLYGDTGNYSQKLMIH